MSLSESTAAFDVTNEDGRLCGADFWLSLIKHYFWHYVVLWTHHWGWHFWHLSIDVLSKTLFFLNTEFMNIKFRAFFGIALAAQFWELEVTRCCIYSEVWWWFKCCWYNTGCCLVQWPWYSSINTRFVPLSTLLSPLFVSTMVTRNSGWFHRLETGNKHILCHEIIVVDLMLC